MCMNHRPQHTFNLACPEQLGGWGEALSWRTNNFLFSLIAVPPTLIHTHSLTWLKTTSAPLSHYSLTIFLCSVRSDSARCAFQRSRSSKSICDVGMWPPKDENMFRFGSRQREASVQLIKHMNHSVWPCGFFFFFTRCKFSKVFISTCAIEASLMTQNSSWLMFFTVRGAVDLFFLYKCQYCFIVMTPCWKTDSYTQCGGFSSPFMLPDFKSSWVLNVPGRENLY